MFDHTSRYYTLETAEYDTVDGRKLAYKRRRFLPQGKTLPLLQEVTVNDGDRLDLIAYDALGDSEVFWQVCDANDAMSPDELTAETGRVLRVAVPQP
ncbi:MAG: hypothetical protein WBA10_01420 [Elainellaceae cyanobacterium]